jgi:anti-anti-sigma factor
MCSSYSIVNFFGGRIYRREYPMAKALQIVVSQQQGRVPVTIFHLSGDIDANSCEILEKQAQEVIEAGARYILLDLAKVTFMSSAGLRTLHVIFNQLRDLSAESEETIRQGLRDGTYKSPYLKLLNPSPVVFEPLRTMGFDMFLEVHRSSKEAVASF